MSRILAHSRVMSEPPESNPMPAAVPGKVAAARLATGGTAALLQPVAPREIGGPAGPEPTRFGDWEKSGRCIDF
jgi:hypothetical protein